jgi:cytidylate kinase
MEKENVIAIDGPAASGKSSAAALVAERLKIPYVNTGNMYRAVTLAALREGFGAEDSDGLGRVLSNVLENLNLRYEKRGGTLKLLLDGEDVDDAIRSPEVAEFVSSVAAEPKVREWLVRRQRKFAELGMIVMEGRDIGTVVFPNAAFKFYLTATPEVRARRRLEQTNETFDGATVETVAAEIAKRDEMDMSREVAPLRKAGDAVLIDSSEMTLDEVVDAVLKLVRPE